MERVSGRLQFADLLEQNKHQVILPQGNPEDAKMVLDLHKVMLHAGLKKRTVNLKTEILADPREVRSLTCYQKMWSLPKTASWTLRAENGPITACCD